MADLQRTVYPHSGHHPSAAGRAQDRVSSPAKYWRSVNCATQPTNIYDGYDVRKHAFCSSCSARKIYQKQLMPVFIRITELTCNKHCTLTILSYNNSTEHITIMSPRNLDTEYNGITIFIIAKYLFTSRNSKTLWQNETSLLRKKCVVKISKQRN